MLIFFPSLHLAVLTVYVVAVSAVPTISATPNLTNSANLDGPSTVIAPGDSIDVTHDYSSVQSGAGDHSIEPPNLFTHVDAEDTPKDLHTTAEGVAKIKLSGSLAAPRDAHDKRFFERGPTFDNCKRPDKKAIQAAIKSARKSIVRVYNGIRRLEMTDKTSYARMYGRWFGPYTKARWDVVMDNLSFMNDAVSFSDYTISCQRGKPASYPARILDDRGLIMIYDLFWNSGEVLQEGTIIRMAGTLSSTIITVATGRVGARDLAAREDRNAVFNLANYEAFIQRASDPYNPSDLTHLDT